MSLNLTDPIHNGIHSLDRGQSLHINLKGVKSKKALLAAVALGLDFPEEFGHNWDALADSLCDPDWASAPSMLITISGAQQAAKNLGEDFSTFQEIVQEATEYWQDKHKAFLVVLGK